jgi:hypothetical protein
MRNWHNRLIYGDNLSLKWYGYEEATRINQLFKDNVEHLVRVLDGLTFKGYIVQLPKLFAALRNCFPFANIFLRRPTSPHDTEYCTCMLV